LEEVRGKVGCMEIGARKCDSSEGSGLGRGYVEGECFAARITALEI